MTVTGVTLAARAHMRIAMGTARGAGGGAGAGARRWAAAAALREQSSKTESSFVSFKLNLYLQRVVLSRVCGAPHASSSPLVPSGLSPSSPRSAANRSSCS